MMNQDKKKVHDFWNTNSCGEKLYLKGGSNQYKFQLNKRYELEPYIHDFADFSSSSGLKVLEIGVGLGADHQMFAESGAILYGIDLTERAVKYTMERFDKLGLKSELNVGDAENLTYLDNTFDIVYSWGVLHHSPNTTKAISEVFRVLRPGGVAKIMIYNKWSMVGMMLWVRYALLTLRPYLSLSNIYSQYLESPGTKAYTHAETKLLFKQFSTINISTVLTHGDLLESDAGQRHQGIFLKVAKTFLPRAFIRKFFSRLGLFMMIEAKK